jgi:FMN-dependent NADH-azoreductase
MNILHIDTSILGTHSVSRRLTADVVAQLTKSAPSASVTYRDLAERPIPHLSGAYLVASRSPETAADPAVLEDVQTGASVLNEFLAADVIVIGVAFYNFTIPSQLKAWVDRVLIAGKTFSYGPNGPEGLAGGKRVILVMTRGGFYGPGTPSEVREHAESYLRSTLAFIGIAEPEVIVAEGLATGESQREVAIAGAGERIAALAA